MYRVKMFTYSKNGFRLEDHVNAFLRKIHDEGHEFIDVKLSECDGPEGADKTILVVYKER